MSQLKKIGEMTGEEFEILLNEYHAPPAERTKLTEEEVRDLAKTLNEKIDVPIIGETGEEKILIKVILKIDGFLYDHLPNEFYNLIKEETTEAGEGLGIDDAEAKRLIVALTKLANKKIDIPYIPEPMEYIAIRLVIGIIINAARKHWNLEKARSNVKETIVAT